MITLFKSNKARRAVYSIKNKYGTQTIKEHRKLNDEDTADDVIGFGSVKDVNTEEIRPKQYHLYYCWVAFSTLIRL